MANRVAEILDSTTLDQWNDLDGVKIPADLATRGFSDLDLTKSDWLQGPFWLTIEDWISYVDQKLTNGQQQKDDPSEVAIDSEAQAFHGALASNPDERERFSQFSCLKF